MLFFESVRPYRCEESDWTRLPGKTQLLDSVGKLNLSQFTIWFTQEKAAIPHFTPRVRIRKSSVVWTEKKKKGGYVHVKLTIVRSAHTLFKSFVFIWEQTATCATYSINWLVFITEMKSVYCAVRTGSLNKAVCTSSLKG
jgi:hypothetical protein